MSGMVFACSMLFLSGNSMPSSGNTETGRHGNETEYPQSPDAASNPGQPQDENDLQGHLDADATRASSLTITDKRHSSYQIVIPERATLTEKYAAEELARYIKKLADVDLPIVRDTNKKTSCEIILGASNTRIDGKLFDAMKWGANGFTIQSSGDQIVIAGGSPRGVIYGVMELLERWGIRFFTDDITRIPKQEKLVVPIMDLTVIPSFSYREVAINDLRNYELLTHLRLTGPVWSSGKGGEKYGIHRTFGGSMGHSFLDLCPPKKFQQEHPEFFSLVDGKRQGGQICLTNKDLPVVIAEELKKRMRSNPAKYWHVSQMDNHDYCRCLACQELADKEGALSGPLVHFINKIADLIKEEFPDRVLVTFAYTYNAKPPRYVNARDNVAVQYCPIAADRLRSLASKDAPPVNHEQVEFLRGWDLVSTELHIWDYVSDFTQGGCFKPFPDYYTWADNLRLYRDLGATLVFLQGAYNTDYAEFSGLRHYVLAKLLWDVDQDPEALIREFCEGVYGVHADLVQAYMHAVYRSALQAHAKSAFTTDSTAGNNKCSLSDDQMKEWLGRFESAIQEEANPVTARYLAQAILPLLHEFLRTNQPSLVETATGVEPLRAPTAHYLRTIDRFEQVAREWNVEAKHLRFLDDIRSCLIPRPFTVLTYGNARMQVIPGIGGSIKRFISTRMPVDISDCFIGNLGRTWHGPGWCEPYIVLTNTADSVTLEARVGKSMEMHRTITLLSDTSYSVQQKVSNRFTEQQTGDMLLTSRLPCASRCEEEIWALGLDGRWQRQPWYSGVYVMISGQRFDGDYGGGGFALVNKTTGLTRVVRWDSGSLDNLISFWHRDIPGENFTVFLYGKRAALSMNQSVSGSITVEYLDNPRRITGEHQTISK